MTWQLWPSDIPGPERPDSNIATLNRVARRRLQSGAQETRRYGSGAPDLVSALIRVTPSQYADLVAFYRDECKMGMLWFEAGWIQNLGYSVDHIGRFSGYPKISHKVGIKAVVVSVLIQDRDLVTE